MALIKVVPPAQRRILHKGDKGDDVLAFGRMVARALRTLGMTPVNAQNGLYGDGLLRDVIRFQHAKHINPNGRVGVLTWQAVDPQMKAYEKWLLRKRPPPIAPVGQRIAHQMAVLLVFGLRIYTQARPCSTTQTVWRVRGSDCSGSGLLSRAIALGVAYDGYGNTDTIWQQGTPVEESAVELGDYIIYGSFSPFKTKHTAIIDDVAAKTAIGFGAVPGYRGPWDYRGDRMGFRRMAH